MTRRAPVARELIPTEFPCFEKPQSGDTARVTTRAPIRSPRESDWERIRSDFWVAPETRDGEPTYVVFAPNGVPLYTFTDLREATSEAELLNAPPEQDLWG